MIYAILVLAVLALLAVVFFFVRKRNLQREKLRIKQEMAKANQFPNEKWIPLICEYLSDTKPVILKLRGNSMRPFLESDRDHGFLLLPKKLKKGDVVLAEIEDKHFVLHRIDSITVNGQKIKGLCDNPEADVTLRGDGNPVGTESCKLKNVRAICVKVRKNNKIYDLNTSRRWKIYSWWWTHTLFMRRYQLALYKLLWRHELPNRWKH